MKHKYTSSSILYRNLDLQFHEDSPTSLQTSHGPWPISLSSPSSCVFLLPKFMVSRHLRLPPLPLAPTVLSTLLGSSSYTSAWSSARFSLPLFQLNMPITWRMQFSALNCAHKIISLKQCLTHQSPAHQHEVVLCSTSTKLETCSLAFKVLHHFSYALTSTSSTPPHAPEKTAWGLFMHCSLILSSQAISEAVSFRESSLLHLDCSNLLPGNLITLLWHESPSPWWFIYTSICFTKANIPWKEMKKI